MSPDQCIDEIIQYAGKHAELQKAHHFLYNLPMDKMLRKPVCVVMGINPGEAKKETESDRKLLQETSREDFHVKLGKTRSEMRWSNLIGTFCNTKNVIQTEFFFWSSSNTGKKFIARFGKPLEFLGQHLRFCANMNQHLLSHHNAKLIIAPGLKSAPLGAAYYDLAHQETTKAANGHRIAERFKDNKNRTWLFTKHWSGSYGLDAAQKTDIRNMISELIIAS